MRINKALLSKEEMDLWNRKLVLITKFVVDVCQANNLRYFVGYGSALGAVRHHGMIPWDNDVDICIPRPDYIKFISKVKSMGDIPDYEILTPEDTPFYYSTQIRVVDKTTSLLFWKRQPCLMGIYVDVFPIDGTSGDIEETTQVYERFVKLEYRFIWVNSKYTLANLWYYFTHGQKERCLRSIVYYCNRRYFRDKILSEIKQLCTRYDYDSSQKVIVYLHTSGMRQLIEKRLVDSVIYVQFENIKVAIPEHFDEYLRHFYGDYMKLPPIEERLERHNLDYLNLYERKSLDEILDIIQ